MQHTQALKKMSRADVAELDNILHNALNVLSQHAATLISGLGECHGDECIELINTELNDLAADAKYLAGRTKEGGGHALSLLIINFTIAMHKALQYLAGFGLLNTEYREFIEKTTIKDVNDALTNPGKVQALLLNMGRILTHAACMAHYRGLTRIGDYVLDKALLLLGIALDETLQGNGEKSAYLIASAFLTLHGKEEEAGKALARAGYEYGNLDRFLNFCSSLTRLYELGIRFTENDYA